MPLDKPHLPSVAKRVALLAAFGVALVFVVSSDALHGWVLEWISYAEQVIRARPVAGKVLFVLFAAAAAMFAFVSSGIMVPVAVLAWGKAASLLLLWLGWILGGIFAYSASRWLGRRVAHWVASKKLLTIYQKWIPRDAPFGLILLFQAALPSEIPGYLLGLARYPFRKYFAALALVELPYAVATVYLGEGFLERKRLLVIGIAILMASFSGLTLRWLRRRTE